MSWIALLAIGSVDVLRGPILVAVAVVATLAVAGLVTVLVVQWRRSQEIADELLGAGFETREPAPVVLPVRSASAAPPAAAPPAVPTPQPAAPLTVPAGDRAITVLPGRPLTKRQRADAPEAGRSEPGEPSEPFPPESAESESAESESAEAATGASASSEPRSGESASGESASGESASDEPRSTSGGPAPRSDRPEEPVRSRSTPPASREPVTAGPPVVSAPPVLSALPGTTAPPVAAEPAAQPGPGTEASRTATPDRLRPVWLATPPEPARITPAVAPGAPPVTGSPSTLVATATLAATPSPQIAVPVQTQTSVETSAKAGVRPPAKSSARPPAKATTSSGAQTSAAPTSAAPTPRSRPAGTTRRGAGKRQQAQLAGLAERFAVVAGRIQLAELTAREATSLVGADTAALVVQSIQGARVLGASSGSADDPEVWGVRTLAALLSRSEPVRVVLDGDPLAGGGRTSLLTAPVPAGGRSVGVLICRRRSPRAFTTADEDALARLGRICGERLHRTPERVTVAVSSIDRATGLGGHDLVRHDLKVAIDARPHHDMPVTLVVAEVVGLARLRTAAGMAAADAALAAAAGRIGRDLRVGDLLYRLSADELAVLLPATDPDGGAAVAERLTDLDLASDPAVRPARDDAAEDAADATADDAPAEPGRADTDADTATEAEAAVGSGPDHEPVGPPSVLSALGLRAVAVAVEGDVESVLLDVSRRLKALQVSQRWADREVV